jgi:antitoxin component YwqK of YwqJK toxin-antitoxin module
MQQNLKSLLDSIKELKSNLKRIERQVSVINEMLAEQSHKELAPKLEQLRHEQLNQESLYKGNNLQPLQVPTSTSSYEQILEAQGDWSAYHEQGKYNSEW